jgi:hypothetical protein
MAFTRLKQNPKSDIGVFLSAYFSRLLNQPIINGVAEQDQQLTVTFK